MRVQSALRTMPNKLVPPRLALKLKSDESPGFFHQKTDESSFDSGRFGTAGENKRKDPWNIQLRTDEADQFSRGNIPPGR
jgi:hypothetical protein